MRFTASRAFDVQGSADDVWRRIADVPSYQRWWPWVTVRGSDRLRVGEPMQISVRSPLVYQVRFTATPSILADGEAVEVAVAGDIVGSGSLRSSAGQPGYRLIEVGWNVEVARPSFRMFGRVGRPVLEWAHNRVVDKAIRQFTNGPAPTSAVGTGHRIARAAVVAGIVSGAPSTAHALLTGRSPFAAARAAGEVFGRPGLMRGAAAHATVSAFWTTVIAGLMRVPPFGRRPVRVGALAGLAIAWLDLGVVARRSMPAIGRLPQGPQVADHMLFGVVAAVFVVRR
ncbi:MAG: hypothetical protein ACR2H3_04775 [Acidimicrobiales bacterium]